MPGSALVAIVNPVPVNWPELLMVHEVAVTMTGAVGTCENVHNPASAGLKADPLAST